MSTWVCVRAAAVSLACFACLRLTFLPVPSVAQYDFPPLPAYSRFLDNLGAWNETALYIQVGWLVGLLVSLCLWPSL